MQTRLIITLFLILVIGSNLIADLNITNSITNTTINYNIPDAVADTNRSNWNNTNWTEKMNKNGGLGAIGNAMLQVNKSPFMQRGMTSNTADLTVDSYNENGQSEAAKGYNDHFRSTSMGNSLTNPAYRPNENTYNNTLECFIARDLPFRYRCKETGLVYGGDTIAESTTGRILNMDGMSGKEALNLCKENCKQEVSCVEVEEGNEETKEELDEEFSFDSNTTYISKHQRLYLDKEVTHITFELNATAFDNNSSEEIEDSRILFDVVYIDAFSKKEVTLAKDVWTRYLRGGEEKLYINDRIESLTFKIHSQDVNATITGSLTNIKIFFKSGSKYICPALQDVSENVNEDYAYQCPSGYRTTFGDFEICSEGVIKGDNDDGTYSDKEVCKRHCNISKNCVVEIGAFDSTIFESMREGRLGRISSDGSYTSADDNFIKSDVDCTHARKTREQVLNEVVFDSSSHPIQTVLAGSLVGDIQRPRVLNSSNVGFEDRKKEEWKDAAYNAMLGMGTFSKSSTTLGEEQPSQNAYYISLDEGANYGQLTSTSQRRLIWRFKPASHLYSNGISYNLYSVIRVDVERYAETISGRETVRDQVWYIKTSTADTFVPFARAKNYATASPVNIGLGKIVPVITKNEASIVSGTNFNTNWNSSSLGMTAPSFKNLQFEANDFWYEMNIFDSIGNIIYTLPGLVRSSFVSNIGVVTDIYSGDFDGTGEGVVGYEVFTFFSEDRLSYNDLKNQIDAIEQSDTHQVDNYGAKIYKTQEEKLFNKFIDGDNIETDSNVGIYQYGTIDKSSLKVRLRPRKIDIGKNAFIYIFMY